jgi:hypothetical protein
VEDSVDGKRVLFFKTSEARPSRENVTKMTCVAASFISYVRAAEEGETRRTHGGKRERASKGVGKEGEA